MIKKLIILILFFSAFLAVEIFAQDSSPDQSEIVQLKADTQKNNALVLVLPFSYNNLSESTALSLAENLVGILNENRSIKTVGTSQLTERYQDSNPAYTICNSIYCGLKIAKDYNTDYILTTNIAFAKGNYNLNWTMANSDTGEIELSGDSSFPTQKIDEEFLKIATKISASLPKYGKILAADKNRVLVDYGRKSGVKLGDKIVVYSQEQSIESTRDGQGYLESKPIAIVEIDNIFENSSGARYQNYWNIPKKDDLTITFGIKSKQLAMSDWARKLIDTYQNNIVVIADAPKAATSDISVKYSVTDETIKDYGKIEWIKQVRYYEGQRELYRWVTAGIGAAMIGLYAAKVKQVYPYAIGLAAGGYSLYKFLDARSNWDRLVDEGKYKGYLDVQWLPGSNIKDYSKPAITLFSYNTNF